MKSSSDRTSPVRGVLKAVYEREFVAYSTVIPATPDLHAAKLYYFDFDPVSGDVIFLMENMNQFYSVGNQLEGCSVNDAKAILSEIAKLHGTWWNHPRIQPGGDLHTSFAPFSFTSAEVRTISIVPHFQMTVVSVFLSLT